MKNAKVSVIVPVFNVEPYLEECLTSLLNQTYTNLEIILSDDGSTDASGSICDQYVGKDSRIKVIHEANGGSSVARNRALDLVSGDYIVFVDSDDMIHPLMIEHLLNIRDSYDADVVISAKPRPTDNPDWKDPSDNEKLTVVADEDILRRYLLRVDNSAVWGKLFKASTIEGLRFVAGVIAEDEVYLADVYPRAKKIVVTDWMCCFYRANLAGVSHTFSPRKYDLVKNALAVEQKMKSIDCELPKERRYHLVSLVVDYCMQVYKHHAIKQYRSDYSFARRLLLKRFFVNLFFSKLSLRYMAKMLLAVVYY